MTVVIASDVDCGEIDPFFIGEACMYKAFLIKGDEREKINIYFMDYSQDQLIAGQLLKMRGINITGSDFLRGKIIYVVQF